MAGAMHADTQASAKDNKAYLETMVHNAFFALEMTLVFYPFWTGAFPFSLKSAAVWALICVVCLSVKPSASPPVQHMNLL